MKAGALIDDFQRDDFVSRLGSRWRGVSDRVMGGVSRESVTYAMIEGRRCLRLRGDVRLENNGGFVQMVLDLDPAGGTLDASAWAGVRLVVRGNGEAYSLHLRTTQLTRPWQSYRAHFTALEHWREHRLPFATFVPHRLEATLDVRRLRRLGLVAIGRAFRADLALAEIGFYG